MRFAVVTTAGERGCLKECLEAVKPQVDRILLVANVPDQKPLLLTKILSFRIFDYLRNPMDCLREPEKPPNLSRLWNVGLDAAERYATLQEADTWHVAVLNDDAIVPYDWFETVVLAMTMTGAAAGCSGPTTYFHDKPGPVGLDTRMTGWAFILDGTKGLRADENLRWWFGDDDLDWQARQAGGMSMTGVLPAAQNLFPNGSMTPELHAQTALDAEYFLSKWGMRPW
jgi:hypothetical protein